MERYCKQIYSRKDFLPENKLKYWNVDIKRIMCDVYDTYDMSKASIDKEDENNIEFRKGLFRANDNAFVKAIELTILSNECELDILNDLYLMVTNACEAKERLYLEAWDEADKLLVWDEVKNTINNYKRKNRTWNLIFDMSELGTTKKDGEISSFGSGVQRLWLASSRFRKLFTITEKDFSKYNIRNIIDILKEGEKKGIFYKVDDYIVLEKLLGLNVAGYFKNNAVKYFEDCDEEDKFRLLFTVLECKGNWSQCRLISIAAAKIGEIMRNYSGTSKWDMVNLYISLLEDLIQDFNERYSEILKRVMKELLANMVLCQDLVQNKMRGSAS